MFMFKMTRDRIIILLYHVFMHIEQSTIIFYTINFSAFQNPPKNINY